MRNNDPMKLREAIVDILPYLESWLEFQRDRARQPGLQVAIRLGDELLYSHAFGLANVETGKKLTTKHLFHVASHSKTFTATAIFQLLEASKLRLDDTLATWLPEMADAPAGEYTLRELLGHQSGIIRDGADSRYWQLLAEFPDREELLRLASGDATFAENEHFKYSNIGYSLLGIVVEAVAGQTYADYCDTHIIAPLGLRNTGAEVPAKRVKDLAAGHSARMFGDDVMGVLPDTSTRAEQAATGFYSTAEEITAYMVKHRLGCDDLVRDASKRLMQRRESTIREGANVRWYGLGFQIMEVGERGFVGHSGGWPGHITQTLLDPQTGLCVSVLGNSLSSSSTEWAAAIVRLIDLVMKPQEKTRVPKDVDIDRFCGRYANMWGTMDIARLGGRLYEVNPAGTDFDAMLSPLTVVNATTLQSVAKAGYTSVGEKIFFEFGPRDSVVKLVDGGGEMWPYASYVKNRQDRG